MRDAGGGSIHYSGNDLDWRPMGGGRLTAVCYLRGFDHFDSGVNCDSLDINGRMFFAGSQDRLVRLLIRFGEETIAEVNNVTNIGGRGDVSDDAVRQAQDAVKRLKSRYSEMKTLEVA